jgi:adhesin/invasin
VVAVLASPLALGSAAAATTAIVMTPSGTVTSVAGTCETYTATGSDGSGSAAGEAVTLTVTETTSTNPATHPFTYYSNLATPSAPCSGTSLAVGTVTGTGPYTITYNLVGAFNASSQVNFGIASSALGTGTVTLASSASVSATANVTWTASGADAVTSVTPNPTTVTQDTGTTASYVVTAKDTNGNVIPGVVINDETNTAASPDQIAPTACGTTNASGQATCSVHNGGTAGTDSLVFWVNNDNGTTHTSGPDAGEPQSTGTAVFKTGPAVSAANSTVTCPQGLAGASQNTAVTTCTLSTSQHAVVFTATVEDASHNPLSGVTVNFTTTAAKLGGTTVTGSNLTALSGTGTTGTNGQTTFTVNDPSAAAGDNATVSASVDGNSIGSATAQWAAPHVTTLNVAPALQSVQTGGNVSVTATVTDQFGTAISPAPALTYVVTGRNTGKAGTAATGGVIAYTDAGTIPATKSDTIAVTDAADGLHGSATVEYTTVAPTASSVVADTSGHGTSDATCGAAGNTPATGVALNATTEVCAVVKDSASEPLAGKTVTFTVSNGQVAAHGALATTSTTTYAATTDAAGVAFADVTSTKSGAQTVTATADSVNGTGTVTYNGPTPAQAYAVAVTSPAAGTTIAESSSQKFVATVTDKNGNPVPGVTVVFTQTGAGSVGNGNTAITAADGTVNVTVTTSATDTGAGTLTFAIGAAPTVANQCSSTGGTCSATASYTVAAAGPAVLTLKVSGAGRVGSNETLTATAITANDTAATNQPVAFYVKVNGKTVSIGTATTGPTGQASVSYKPTKAGTTNFAALTGTTGQIREATATAQIRAVEKPSVSLTSKNGHVTIHVASHPTARSATVRYFVKRNGSWARIGTSKTGPGGNASKTFSEAKGKRLTFRATVARTSSTTGGTTVAKSITVKK